VTNSTSRSTSTAAGRPRGAVSPGPQDGAGPSWCGAERGRVQPVDLSSTPSRVFDYKKAARRATALRNRTAPLRRGFRAGGKGLRQLTFRSADDGSWRRAVRLWHQRHAALIPAGGSVIFTSTRCRTSTLATRPSCFTTTVRTAWTPTAGTSAACATTASASSARRDADGPRALHAIVQPQGRGRGQGPVGHAPDGAAASEVYGNLIVDSGVMLSAGPARHGGQDPCSWLLALGPNKARQRVLLATSKTLAARGHGLFSRDVDARTHGGYSSSSAERGVDEKRRARRLQGSVPPAISSSVPRSRPRASTGATRRATALPARRARPRHGPLPRRGDLVLAPYRSGRGLPAAARRPADRSWLAKAGAVHRRRHLRGLGNVPRAR
jgi:hypothetical protein